MTFKAKDREITLERESYDKSCQNILCQLLEIVTFDFLNILSKKNLFCQLSNVMIAKMTRKYDTHKQNDNDNKK